MPRGAIPALALAVATLINGASNSSAQQSTVDKVKEAIAAYHAALETLDVAKMAPLWVHDQSVMLVNPRDTTAAIGWDAVEKDWEATFAPESELKIEQTAGPYISVTGNIAWATGIVSSAIKLKSGQAVNAATFQTDVFEKRGEKWMLVSHAAWRVPK